MRPTDLAIGFLWIAALMRLASNGLPLLGFGCVFTKSMQPIDVESGLVQRNVKQSENRKDLS